MLDVFLNIIIIVIISFIIPYVTDKAYSIYKPQNKISYEYDQSKLITMIIISIIYMVIGFIGLYFSNHISFNSLKFGGIFLLIANIFKYWNVLKIENQMMLIGMLASVIMYFYNQIKTSLYP